MTRVTQLAGMTLFAGLIGTGTAAQQQPEYPQQMPTELQLQQMVSWFAPVEIGADVGALPATEQAALAKMVEAARLMDGLFLQQVWAGNP